MSKELARQLVDCGFDRDQAECLLEIFALRGHSHEIEDIVGLDEELDTINDSIDAE